MAHPKQIILHIGYNKTGSSALQSMLASNRNELNALGLIYPATGEHGTAHYLLSAALTGFPGTLPKGQAAINSLTKNLQTEIHNTGTADNIIFSSEYFHLASTAQIIHIKDWLSAAFPEVTVKIIVYLRRHDKWLASVFNQAEKHWLWGDKAPYMLSISSFLSFTLKSNSEAINYLLTLDKWANIFGTSNIIVRSFQSNRLLNQCICDDFLSLFLSPIPVVNKPRLNESLADEELLLAALWNRVIGKRFPINQLPSNNSERSLRDAIPDRLLNEVRFTPQQSQGLVERFKSQYKAIEEKYMTKYASGLFDLD